MRVLLALTGALLVPSTASAATVYADVHGLVAPGGPVVFDGAPGEANDVTVTQTANQRLRFHEGRYPLRARGQCRAVDAHTAICPDTEDVADVRTHDGDDRITLRVGVIVYAHGGQDDDTVIGRGGNADYLYGGSGGDRLRGGAGDDRLFPGSGRDRIAGGRGDDVLVDEGDHAHDVFAGGPQDAGGRGDEVDYSSSRRDLRVDLSRGTTSGGDRLRGVESLTLGSGDDRVTGSAAANSVYGGPGDDVLRGLAGDDELGGAGGQDRIAGGAGDDQLRGDAGRDALSGGVGDDALDAGSAADAVRCGAGADFVFSTPAVRLAGECEEVAEGDAFFATVPVLDADSADYAVRCPYELDDPCSGTVTLAGADGATYGSAAYSVPAEGAGTVSVPLTPAGRAAIAGGTDVVVTIRPAGERAGGYRIRLQG